MHNTIIDYISKFVSLTDDEIAIIIEQNIFKHCKKNEILLAAGRYSKECYFVIKGCLRAYYLKNDEERNVDFFFENQTVIPISYQTNEPSAYYLACIEDCLLAIGDEARNKKLIELVPKLAFLIAKKNDDLLLQKTVELFEFKNHSPEERYLLLLENKPAYLNRIPLFHLASYLGITQISLSRIRSRILHKQL